MERVLVCDDDLIISEVVAIILFDSDTAEVFSFQDCDNIIEKIESTNPSVILMDHNIPHSGGIIATRTIKEHSVHKQIPVIYFSSSDNIKAHARSAGADYILAKPFTTDQLEKLINECIYNRNQALKLGGEGILEPK